MTHAVGPANDPFPEQRSVVRPPIVVEDSQELITKMAAPAVVSSNPFAMRLHQKNKEMSASQLAKQRREELKKRRLNQDSTR